MIDKSGGWEAGQCDVFNTQVLDVRVTNVWTVTSDGRTAIDVERLKLRAAGCRSRILRGVKGEAGVDEW